MKDFIDEETIAEYIEEHNGLAIAINTLQERQYTIDTILRHEHNFAIGKDRL
jgi:hypothetical protein